MNKESGIWTADLALHIDGKTIEAEPVIMLPGQAAEARVAMDSATASIGEVKIDVFDVDMPTELTR